MARRIPALVNPPLLAWAREQAGYSIEEAAKKAKVTPAKLKAWESKSPGPTLRQAENLAKLYHRAYSVFSLPEPPNIPPLASEYRRLPNVTPGKESPELRVALRHMIYRRNVALDLIAELGGDPEQFSIVVRLGSDPEAAAQELRAKLGITLEQQYKWENEFQAWREWRQAVEGVGTLVFQFPKVDPEEVRGVSILEFPLPAVGVNSKEVPGSKPFTLLHELVHLALARADEEKPAASEGRTGQAWRQVEGYAEAVAGAVLMPAPQLLGDSLVRGRSSWSVDEMRRLARRYKVTPLAMATRLLRVGPVSPHAYQRWRADWNRYLKEHPPKKPRGFATPPAKALSRNGLTFTTLVLEALTTERVTAIEAARYLDLRYPHIETLRRELTFGRGRPVEAETAE
jgi:Zn-dependent peptidase ImmA (M78 family)/DNA-binding XRE family transcriptional regulator